MKGAGLGKYPGLCTVAWIMEECESGLGAEYHGDELDGGEMEVDGAGSAADTSPYPPTMSAQECTEGTEDTPFSFRPVTSRPTMPNRNIRLCIYDRNFFQPRSSLSERVRSTMNCLKQYEVREPIGCAVLLSSDGSQNDLTSVEGDVGTIAVALQMGGWDVICRASKLDSGTLWNYLSALGKEKQLRYLGLQTRDLAEYSVFMLYYTGHGTEEGVVLNDGGLFHYRDIVTKVAEVPCLSQKPKLFIFDSCRKKNTSPNEFGLVTSKNHFFSWDLEIHHKRLEKFYLSYPPSHTMICFSAAEGRPSFQDTVEGSFYTLALSHALKQFGSELSFHEIITQVNGGTNAIASAYGKEQKPIFKSNLEKLLVLNSECWERRA